ncbi:MAG: trigger factor [Chloroflexi bacterium]|nr:trigger factor [Chloroflexota bacterium]
MKVTLDKKENSQAFLTVEMEPTEVEAELQKAYSRLVKKANVPGFRKGKAPRDVLEGYLGKEALFNDALEHLIPEACENAILEQDIEAFAHPQIEVTQLDPVVFKATVPLKPTVELGDYLNVRVAPQTVEVTEDDTNQTIERLRHSYATWEPVVREVGYGDLVVMDIESHLEDEPFINQKEAQYQVVQDAPTPVPGFAEQLVGMKLDEEKEFPLKFPDDYAKSEVAGKEPDFKVKVTEVKQEQLPELNDEFARQVDAEVETLDSLKEKITTAIRNRAEENAVVEHADKVVKAVTDQAQVEFPPVLVEMEVNRLIDEQLRRWQMTGQDVEHYLSYIGKSEEQLREELRPQAGENVSQSLVLAEVTDVEKVEVGDSEIDAEIENLTTTDAENKDKIKDLFNTPQYRESIRRWLQRQNTVKRLVEIAGAPAGEEK